MYLTRLDLRTDRQDIGRLLGNEQRIHALLCRLCDARREDAKILYRLVHDRHRHAVYMYSACPVDRQRLQDGIRVRGERDLSDWLASISDGDILQFDLVAVPSKKEKRDGALSRRVLLRTPEERIAWMQRKSQTNGFELLECTEEEHRSAYVYQSRGQNKFRMGGVHFSGLLRVTNAAEFRRALQDGIGPERAYGFGMLMVKRP